MGWNFVSCSCHRAEVNEFKIAPAHFRFSILPQICNLGYGWYFNGITIPGATADTLELVRAGINRKHSPLAWLLPGYRKLLARKQRRVLVDTQFLTKTRHPLIRAGHLCSLRPSGRRNCLMEGYYHGAINDGYARNSMRRV